MNQALAVFSNRTFLWLWFGTVVSNVGGTVQQVGAAWEMTLLTASSSMIALVQACVTLPIMLGSYPAGVLADCRDRRAIMLFAQIFMAVVSTILAVMAWLGLMTAPLLLFFTFLVGCGTALQYPAWQASIGAIVSRDKLPAAVAANAMGTNLVRSLGPAIGGFIVAMSGSPMAFAINAASYLAVIWALKLWRPAPEANALPAEKFGPAMRAGWRYFAASGDKIPAIFRGFLFCSAAIGVQALLPAIVRNEIGGEATLYGVLLGAFGFGAVVAALFSNTLRAKFGLEVTSRIGFLVYAASVTALMLWPSVPMGLVTMLLCGASWLITLSLINISIQVSTPKWVLGRMMAIYMTSIFGGMTLGSWAWGQAAQGMGLGPALFLSAGLLVLGAAWGLWSPITTPEADEGQPLVPSAKPVLRIGIQPDQGPVQVTVDYAVPDEAEDRFLHLMELRRRGRVRAGVLNWTLQHDVETPSLWIETYSFATWADYLRHNARKTAADAAILEELFAIHAGIEPPQVRRTIGSRSPKHLAAAPLP